jgi:hypothetical protein
MAKSLLYLFSAGIIAVSVTGCSFGTCPGPVVVTAKPEVVYPKYNTSKKFNITAKKQGGNIVMTTSEFKKVTAKIASQKYQIKTLQEILDSYNKWDFKTIK